MSSKREAFIVRHEGFVSRAYRDPVGIVTIGTGFTNRSRTAREWWLRTRGRKIKMGDTISREENDRLLKAALDHEYGKPVGAALGRDAPQHALDAGTSVSFNCGPGSLNWSWAKLYKSGDRRGSAARLRRTAVTARGRRLRGLERRRAEEASLLEHGHYGSTHSASRYGRAIDTREGSFSKVLQQDQQLLNALGYKCGINDGKWGPKTEAAVLRLQRDHDLLADGILGPATRAKLVRLANAKRETTGVATGGGAVSTTGVAVPEATAGDVSMFANLSDWLLIGGVFVAVAGLIYLIWFYRDEVLNWMDRL